MARLDVDGVDLEYVALAGASDGPTVLFLHEGLGAVSTWRDFPARLCARLGLPGIVYSRAGYGASGPVPLPRPLTYMQDEARDVVPRLVDRLGLEEVVLLGHSDGASIALAYAASEHGRARVRAVIVEAPHVFCEQISVRAIEDARQAYLHDDLKARLAKHHADVDLAFWGWNHAWLDPGFRAWNIEACLPRIRAPALLVQCEDDPYGTLAQLDAIERGSGGPTRRLVFEEGGHAPHRAHADALIAAAAGFIAELSKTRLDGEAESV